MQPENTITWQHAPADVFWGEIAPAEHLLQIYENDEAFINTLAGFVMHGIETGDNMVVIATEEHLAALENALQVRGLDVAWILAGNRYFPLNAEKILDKFMVNGWPDELLFMNTVGEIIRSARTNNRKVRAFGEMVALLWSQGLNGATVQLENLWSKVIAGQLHSLFCAYPRIGFTQGLSESLQDICCAHTRLIEGSSASTEIAFRSPDAP
ncbi:MAG TPA: MEDS domain-containing protein [Flavisolibacter sp.]